eukprot:TRINITY_DN7780_c0_g3_i1.p2 TRINITY_DN7780_c0_g3~~TRINITY_DN7780_c0_g3_i1.p2  ORF type:complete len:237 (+),score=-30.70 TRINITY_DN7780_c0_g3_i1:2225-2935(+)
MVLLANKSLKDKILKSIYQFETPSTPFTVLYTASIYVYFYADSTIWHQVVSARIYAFGALLNCVKRRLAFGHRVDSLASLLVIETITVFIRIYDLKYPAKGKGWYVGFIDFGAQPGGQLVSWLVGLMRCYLLQYCVVGAIIVEHRCPVHTTVILQYAARGLLRYHRVWYLLLQYVNSEAQHCKFPYAKARSVVTVQRRTYFISRVVYIYKPQAPYHQNRYGVHNYAQVHSQLIIRW